MSKLTSNVSRRHFLKGAAYLSVLSVGGASSAALAIGENQSHAIAISSPSVTLSNQSDKAVFLNASQPVSLEHVNGWVVAAINKASDQSTDQAMTLLPGQERTFAVDPGLASLLKAGDDYIAITNEYSAVSNMVPIFTYDEQFA
ncbi:MAG: hypothetical protein ACRBEE_06680 [Arenicella sp.]